MGLTRRIAPLVSLLFLSLVAVGLHTHISVRAIILRRICCRFDNMSVLPFLQGLGATFQCFLQITHDRRLAELDLVLQFIED